MGPMTPHEMNPHSEFKEQARNTREALARMVFLSMCEHALLTVYLYALLPNGISARLRKPCAYNL
jgi:hypothetical protein